MKKIFYILLLLPTFIFAQYPSNSGHKLRLGEQTTADGLVYRGLAADTTRKPSVDTMAYIILDTTTNLLWHYKKATSNKWLQAGGSTLDTATMLLPYYRSGRNTIIQASDVPTLNQNTTGSAATLTTSRTIQTNLASTSSASFNGSANITPGVTGTLPVANGGTGATTFTAGLILFGNGTSAINTNTNLFWDNSNSRVGIGTSSPTNKFEIASNSNTYAASPSITFTDLANDANSNRWIVGNIATDYGSFNIASTPTPSSTTYTPRITILRGGNVGIGTTSPTEKLHVVGNGLFTGIATANKFIVKTNTQSLEIKNNHPSSGAGNNLFIGTGGANNSYLNSTYYGGYNTGIGVGALDSLTSGPFNIALGGNALKNCKSCLGNVAIGGAALGSSTTAELNVAIGLQALYTNISGIYNVGLGYNSLYYTTGSQNLGLGYFSLFNNSSGENNIGIGVNAGYGTNGTNSNTTGSNNTFIGYQSVGSSATASNVITLGNSSIATIRAQVTTITSLSDMRDKKDIMPLNYGMNFIENLKPVSFFWDMRDGGKIGIPEIGFIAQDLQQAQIDTGVNIPNLVSGVDEKLEASYGVLLPIIVKALQEANEKIKSLEQRIINLENK